MDESPISRKRELVATLAVLLVIVAIVGAVTVTHKKKIAANASTMPSATAVDSAPTSSAAVTPAANSNASFKDGQYSATGGYQSPGGSEEISVTVTLKNGVITETSAKSGATDAEAEEYQNKFIKGYKDLVVGKSISSVSLSRVSGSSLTSIGFNNAINQIKSQAKA